MRLRHCLLVLALAGPTALPAEGTAERVVVVARVGKLSEAEVSPSPQLKVPALWRLALDGVSLTRIELKGVARIPNSLDELKLALLPDPAAGEVVDWRPRTSGAAQRSPGLQALHGLVGVPPPLTAAEAAGIEAFRTALGSTRSTAPAASQGRIVSTSDLSWLSRSAVTLVRVDAASDAAADVVERDELLERVTEAAGPAANVVVVNLPDIGAGTIMARGPRLKRARVNANARSIAAVKGLVTLFLDPTAAEKNPALGEESMHELFR